MARVDTSPVCRTWPFWAARALPSGVRGPVAYLLCLTEAVLFPVSLPRMRVLVRPICVRLNILPPVTTGIAETIELESTIKE
jgi:hypothetical protein